LLPKVKHLILVERDPLLASYLKRTLPASNYTLITADILNQHIPRFYPRPKIFSEVIKIEFNELDLPQGFIKFVEHGFTARRKKLKNVFKQYKFDNLGDKRPDQLTPDEWLTIYNRLKRYDNH